MRCQVTTTETEEEELPVWARREVVHQLERQDGVDLPFGVYLLASALVAIAAVSPQDVLRTLVGV